jgi:3-isopropylmalate/(R)-2-methylmalate dehydratase small subunit
VKIAPQIDALERLAELDRELLALDAELAGEREALEKRRGQLRHLEDKLGSARATRFVEDGQLDSEYPIILAGRNFGCGSSREHAPIALGSARCRVILAESFARIFFRNCVATGELYPCEITDRLCEELNTGDVVTVDLDKATVTVEKSGNVHSFKPLGDVRPVVDAGGLFNYARETGMMPSTK